jgi:alpha-galactosidase
VNDDLSQRATHFDAIAYGVKDLWTAKNLGTTKKVLNIDVPAHDVLLLRLSKQ